MKTEAREIGAEARLRTGHAEVGHHRKPKAAADSGAVYCRDDRLFGAEQAVALDIQWRDTRSRLVGAGTLRLERRAVAVIGPSTERFALRRQYDRTNVAVSVEALESVSDVLDQRDIKEVVRRPPDLDQSDMAGFFDADITHGVCPCSDALCRSASCAVCLTIKASTNVTPSQTVAAQSPTGTSTPSVRSKNSCAAFPIGRRSLCALLSAARAMYSVASKAGAPQVDNIYSTSTDLICS